MLIKDFCEAYKAKSFMNTPQGFSDRAEWIRNELGIKKYISFRDKRKIAEMIVEQNITVVDGIKRYDNIDAYIGSIMASIVAHTNLQCSNDTIADYDLLAESGLLPLIVTEFQESHNEIDVLLKMSLAAELEDNNTNVLIGKFLDAVLKKLDGVSGLINNLNLEEKFSEENVAKIIGFLNK